MIRSPSPTPPTIFADYQASTPVDLRVAEVLERYTRASFANPHATEHILGWQAAKLIESAKRDISLCLGCDADEIVFTSGATESNNLAVLGLAERADERRRILVSAIEHKCVLAAAERAARLHGCVVERLRVDASGAISLSDLAQRLSDDVLIVSVMGVNNEIGSIAPLDGIAALCARVGAIFHTDAAQALPAMTVNLHASGIGLASFSGHKIYGPKGIGILYVRRDLQPQIAAQIVGGGQQNGLRSGTLPLPLCMAMAHAIELMSGMCADDERIRIANLRDRFVAELLKSPKVSLNGPSLRQRHPGNCNMQFSGCDAHDLLMRLQPIVAASTGSACATGALEPSYVLRSIGLNDEAAASSIRFSFGRFTTDDDVDQTASAILKLIA